MSAIQSYTPHISNHLAAAQPTVISGITLLVLLSAGSMMHSPNQAAELWICGSTGEVRATNWCGCLGARSEADWDLLHEAGISRIIQLVNGPAAVFIFGYIEYDCSLIGTVLAHPPGCIDSFRPFPEVA